MISVLETAFKFFATRKLIQPVHFNICNTMLKFGGEDKWPLTPIMATIKTTYLGGLRTEATHLQSGTTILTDAPVDNKGKGEAFSPTDLLAESLAGCILTTMAIAADTHGINIDNTTAEVTKIMAPNPRRVAEVIVNLQFPKTYSEKEVKILELAATTCPVAISLHPDVKKTINFGW